MALKLALVVVAAVARISGPLALLLPETTEFAMVILPAVVLRRAMPPPPVLMAVPLAVLLEMVLF
jgi:hypothetical protein